MSTHHSHRRALVYLVLSLAMVGCIDSPPLATIGDSRSVNSPGGGGGASEVSGVHDGMVLVPAVSLPAAGTIAPSAAKGGGGGKDEDHGGKNEGADAGGSRDDDDGGPAGESVGGGSVLVPAFWIDAREVTAGAYRACVDAGHCTPPLASPGCTMGEGLDAHPVNCISLVQARVFCTSFGRRLVTSEQWTAAAAGEARRSYPWGMEPPAGDRLNACGAECAPAGMYAASDGYVRTAPGGAFPRGRTPEGVDDLAGNVAEWVETSEDTAIRGGSYGDVAVSLVTSTHAGAATAPGPSVGFRCAAEQ